MSLNRTLDRFFDEIRREAKRNRDFANRLEAVLQRHESRREVADGALEGVVTSSCVGVQGAEGDAPEAPVGATPTAAHRPAPAVEADAPPVSAQRRSTPVPAINPAGLYKREGEAALRKGLEGQDLGALRALVAEHNLDPSGLTLALTREDLLAHILAQAKRRAERDDKMFDY